MAQAEAKKIADTDCIIRQEGSKNAALLKVVSNEELMKNEKQVIHFLK